MHKDKSGQSLVKTASDMAEPLLPDHTSVQDNPKHSVSLSRFVTVGGITLTIFILFIIILASQLPAQQIMGMTTVGLNTDGDNWVRTIYGEYKLFDDQCRDGCDFEEAAVICEAEGGHLPFIQSEEENEEIKV
jgi:hypothetical protein